jgi:HEAT repeat protein
MEIKVTCVCGNILAFDSSRSGKTGKCPKCKRTVRVPEPELDLDGLDADELKIEGPELPAPLPLPTVPSQHFRIKEEFKPEKPKTNFLKFALYIGGFLLLAGVIVYFVMGAISGENPPKPSSASSDSKSKKSVKKIKSPGKTAGANDKTADSESDSAKETTTPPDARKEKVAVLKEMLRSGAPLENASAFASTIENSSGTVKNWLKSKEAQVRLGAARLMVFRGEGCASEIYSALAEDEDAENRIWGLRELAAAFPKAAEKKLLDALRSEEPRIAAISSLLIARYGTKKAESGLLEIFRSGDNSAAIGALACGDLYAISAAFADFDCAALMPDAFPAFEKRFETGFGADAAKWRAYFSRIKDTLEKLKTAKSVPGRNGANDEGGSETEPPDAIRRMFQSRVELFSAGPELFKTLYVILPNAKRTKLSPDLTELAVYSLARSAAPHPLARIQEFIASSTEGDRAPLLNALVDSDISVSVNMISRFLGDAKTAPGRCAVITALGRAYAVQSTEAIRKYMDSEDPAVARAAFEALATLGDQSAAAYLPSIKLDEDLEAPKILARIASPALARSIEKEIEKIENPGDAAGHIAVLGHVGDKKSAEFLCAYLERNKDRAPEEAVFAALGRIGDESCALPLARYAHENSRGVREAAFDVLIKLPNKKAAIMTIKSITEHDEISAKAIATLSTSGDKSIENDCRDLLRKMLKSPDPGVKKQTIIGLGFIGSRSDAVEIFKLLPAGVREMTGKKPKPAPKDSQPDSSPEKKDNKIEDGEISTEIILTALARLHYPNVLPILTTYAESAGSAEIIIALGIYGGPEAEKAILQHVASANSGMRKAAWKALAMAGAECDPVSARDVALNGGARSDYRIEAIRFLTACGGRKSSAAILQVITDPSSKIRAEAARDLGNSGSEESAAALVLLMFDDSPVVRAEAAVSLLQAKNHAGVRELIWNLDSYSEDFRMRAAEALAKVSGIGYDFSSYSGLGRVAAFQHKLKKWYLEKGALLPRAYPVAGESVKTEFEISASAPNPGNKVYYDIFQKCLLDDKFDTVAVFDNSYSIDVKQCPKIAESDVLGCFGGMIFFTVPTPDGTAFYLKYYEPSSDNTVIYEKMTWHPQGGIDSRGAYFRQTDKERPDAVHGKMFLQGKIVIKVGQQQIIKETSDGLMLEPSPNPDAQAGPEVGVNGLTLAPVQICSINTWIFWIDRSRMWSYNLKSSSTTKILEFGENETYTNISAIESEGVWCWLFNSSPESQTPTRVYHRTNDKEEWFILPAGLESVYLYGDIGVIKKGGVFEIYQKGEKNIYSLFAPNSGYAFYNGNLAYLLKDKIVIFNLKKMRVTLEIPGDYKSILGFTGNTIFYTSGKDGAVRALLIISK